MRFGKPECVFLVLKTLYKRIVELPQHAIYQHKYGGEAVDTVMPLEDAFVVGLHSVVEREGMPLDLFGKVVRV